MNKGVPQGEAFVPPEEQDHFAELASVGEQQKVIEEEKNKQADKDLTIGAALNLAGGVVAFTPLGPLAAAAIIPGAFYGFHGVKERLDADKAGEKKENAFDATRTIVNREMRKGAATQVSGEMRATAE